MKASCVLLTGLAAALLVIVLLPSTAQSQDSKTVRIGVLLENVDPLIPKVFDKAFYLLNRERSYGAKPRLDYQIETVNEKDSFTASKKVCEMLEKSNVAAILGPETLTVSFHLDSMSSSLFIPYIKMIPDFYTPPLNDYDGRNIPHRQSASVVPQPQRIGKAIADYIFERKWYREFILLYEDVEALFRAQDAMKLTDVTVQSMQLDPDGDYRPQLKAIKDEGYIMKIIIDCSIDKVTEFFKQAESVGMITEIYDYFIVNLDMYALDFRRFSSRAVNITGFRLVKNDLPEFKDFEAQVRSLYSLEEISVMPFGIKTHYAYIYDAILLAMNTIDKLFENKDTNAIYSPSISCRNHSKLYSQKFVNALLEMEIEGLTGKISFDKHGVRRNYNLTLLKMQKDAAFNALAEWNDNLGIHNIFSEEQLQEQTAAQLSNQTIRITTIKNTPFFNIKEDAHLFEGNDKYEGFSVDLIYAMAKKGNFIPIIKPVVDGKYGDNKTSGIWNGMVGALIKQEAEAAVADLTITRTRQDAVDFTTPFMNLGISILFKKPVKTPPSLFSFLLPFDSSVWICMGTAYLGVSIVLFVLARISPSEWDNPHPCDTEPEELENQFNLINCMWFAMGSLLQQGCDFLPKISPYEWGNPHPCNPDPEELENIFQPLNSFWFTIGSLMQQGSDLAPKAISTRIIASVWWFFTLIMISSYTANLAAYLTSSMMVSPIKSVEDLAKQTKYKYGCVKGGSTSGFFSSSGTEVYQHMWKTMQDSEPTVFCENNREGVDRVLKGDYAFFMESTVIKYEIERNCDLMQVGQLLDNKGYGVATRKGSIWWRIMNDAILRLLEDGTILRLQKKWWERPPDEGTCEDDSEKKSPMDEQKLAIGNVGGVFVLLFAGMGLAIVVGIIEFGWNTHKMSVEENVTMKEELKKEIKFIVNCNNTTKPVVKPPSEPDLQPGIRLEIFNGYNDTEMHM